MGVGLGTLSGAAAASAALEGVYDGAEQMNENKMEAREEAGVSHVSNSEPEKIIPEAPPIFPVATSHTHTLLSAISLPSSISVSCTALKPFCSSSTSKESG